MSETVAEVMEYSRLLKSDGGVNLRDLGGYGAKDGRKVKWRTIFRSGHLRDLSDADRRILKEIDLRTIHDFRRSSEIEKFPSATGSIEIVEGYEMGVGSMGMFIQALEVEDFSPDEAHDFIVGAYNECVEEVTGPYKAFFQHLLHNPEGSFLFHCMAGKDRTGLAAALILHILDVPRETILQDYMLTAEYLPLDRMVDTFLKSRDGIAEAVKRNRASLAPYCGVHADNLNAFFAGVDALYGSVDSYVSDGLKMSDGDVEELRGRYLL